MTKIDEKPRCCSCIMYTESESEYYIDPLREIMKLQLLTVKCKAQIRYICTYRDLNNEVSLSNRAKNQRQQEKGCLDSAAVTALLGLASPSYH